MRVHDAIVFASDMNRSVAFCRDVLTLPLRFESPDWTEFATEGATPALHSDTPSGRATEAAEAAGTCRPGFGVASLYVVHRGRSTMRCGAPPKAAFARRIARYADPDGLVLPVSEARA